MGLKIKYKLFIILLAASIVIIACMFLFTRLSFEHGFLRYVDKIETKRLDTLCRILEEAYSNEGNWQFLKDNPEEWYRLQDYPLRKWRHKRHDSSDGYRGNEGNQRLDHEEDPHYGRGGRMGRRHREMPCPPEKCPNIILLDKEKNPVLGRVDEADEVRLRPILFDNETVGWLGMTPLKSFTEEDELVFFREQSRMFLLISIAMVIISIIVAIWTAYSLEGPINTLTRGTKSLASGKYDTRIPVKSKDELGQLSRDFNTLAKTLEENEKGRKQWVADIAHELRTPLTLLSGELQAIQDGVRELSPETLKLLNDDIAHLIRLVNDLNELSRTELGALSYKKEDIDLVKVLQRTLERFRDEFDTSGLHLDAHLVNERPVMMLADSERMGQLFGNLLQNSLNYTDESGRVKIWLDRKDGTVVFNIQDSEPGVTEEALPRLFDRLFRVEPSRNRTFGGTGLGLAICKNIAEAHEGDITASPSPMGGLWLRVAFPVKS